MWVLPNSSAQSQRVQLLFVALVPALIVVLSITGFVWAQREITVTVDGETLHMKTQAPDVATVLAEAGVQVDGDDLVTPALDAPLEHAEAVLVRHSVPVELDLGGGKVKMDVVGDTVADALVAAGADPATNPEVTPSPDTKLSPGMTISVPDVFMRVFTRESTVAAPVRYEKDSSLGKGSRRVVSAGDDGAVMRVYRVLVSGGVEGAPMLTEELVVRQAKARVIAVGTGIAAAPIDPETGEEITTPPASGRAMQVVATGYSPRQPDLDFVTATGARAGRGIIAVDPRVIPLGTRVYVPGYGYAIAADTGGAIDGNRIDLCFETVEECFDWGRRTVTIIILD